MSYDAFRKHRIVLALLGVSISAHERNKRFKWLPDLYLTVNISSLTLFAILYTRGAVLYTHDHLLDRMIGLAAAISVTSALTKMIIFRLNRGLILQLMNELGHLKCNTSLGKRIRKVTTFYEIAAATIILTHNTDYWTHSEPTRQSPFYTQSKTGEIGEVTRDYFYTLYGAVNLLTSNVIGDTMFLVLACQICYRLHRLANTINFIGKAWIPKDVDVIDIEGKVTDKLLVRACVEEHNLLLKLTNDIEDLYYGICVSQLASSFLCICVSLFTFTEYDDVSEGVKEIFPQVVSLFLEIFLYCWGGQIVSNHYEKLHFAIYNSNWMNCEKEIKSSVLIIEAITARPKYIAAASVFHLSYHFFETLCRETFSAYTIMYQFLT